MLCFTHLPRAVCCSDGCQMKLLCMYIREWTVRILLSSLALTDGRMDQGLSGRSLQWLREPSIIHLSAEQIIRGISPIRPRPTAALIQSPCHLLNHWSMCNPCGYILLLCRFLGQTIPLQVNMWPIALRIKIPCLVEEKKKWHHLWEWHFRM